MSEWISVKDRLPEDKVSVLIFVASENKIHASELCDLHKHGLSCEDWHLSYDSHEFLGFPKNEVTHWMHLPSPPKDTE